MSSHLRVKLCAQSLFFFRFSKRSARARKSRAAKRRDAKTGAATREDLSVFCLSRLAPSVTHVVNCVSRAYVLLDGPKKKERPLLVYLKVSKMNNVWSYTCTSNDTQSFNTADAFYTHNCPTQ